MAESRARARGRPVGGGNSLEHTKRVLMDAAERSFVDRGIRASTIEVIAGDAGYSRSAVYRIFPNRRTLIEACVHRTTQQYILTIPQRLSPDAGPEETIVQSLVIVATELARDPLLRTVAEQSSDGTVAEIIAHDAALTGLVRSVFEVLLARDDDHVIRPGLHPHDIAQYFVATALGMLLDVVPGLDDPERARRYIETFVMPAILSSPRAPEHVWAATDPPA